MDSRRPLATGANRHSVKLRACPQHGEYEALSYRVGGKLFWSGCPRCVAEEKARIDREAAKNLRSERQASRQHRAEALLGGGIPERYLHCCLDNYATNTEGEAHALHVAQRYVDTFAQHLEDGAGLAFLGRPGTGKTHLATAIASRLRAQSFCVGYTRALDLVQLARMSHERDSRISLGETNTVLTDLDLLVLDELGSEGSTHFSQATIDRVILMRYDRCRPTIAVANKNYEGLAEALGARIAERLCAPPNFCVAFNWGSRRDNLRDRT